MVETQTFSTINDFVTIEDARSTCAANLFSSANIGGNVYGNNAYIIYGNAMFADTNIGGGIYCNYMNLDYSVDFFDNSNIKNGSVYLEYSNFNQAESFLASTKVINGGLFFNNSVINIGSNMFANSSFSKEAWSENINVRGGIIGFISYSKVNGDLHMNNSNIGTFSNGISYTSINGSLYLKDCNIGSIDGLCSTYYSSFVHNLSTHMSTPVGSTINGTVELNNSTFAGLSNGAFTKTSIKGGYLNILNVNAKNFSSVASGSFPHGSYTYTGANVTNIQLMGSTFDTCVSGFQSTVTTFINASTLSITENGSACFAYTSATTINGQNCNINVATSLATGARSLKVVEFQNSYLTNGVSNAFSGYWYNTGSSSTLYPINYTTLNTYNSTLSGSGSGFAYAATQVTAVDMSKVKGQGLTSVSSMFDRDSKLRTVNFTNSYINGDSPLMFNGCQSLTNIDFTNAKLGFQNSWNYMFTTCVALPDLNVTTATIENGVRSWSHTFENCASLINITGLFNKSSLDMKVNDFTFAFSNCRQLASNLDFTQAVKPNDSINGDLNESFFHCDSVKEIKFDNSSTKRFTKVSNPTGGDYFRATNTFRFCKNVRKIDLSMFEVHDILDSSYMFEQCANLETIVMPNIQYCNYGRDARDSKDKLYAATLFMFQDCPKLTKVIFPYYDESADLNVPSQLSNQIFQLSEDFGSPFLNTPIYYGAIAGTTPDRIPAGALTNGKIYVPDALVEKWKVETNWVTLEPVIRPLSELGGNWN